MLSAARFWRQLSEDILLELGSFFGQPVHFLLLDIPRDELRGGRQ